MWYNFGDVDWIDSSHFYKAIDGWYQGDFEYKNGKIEYAVSVHGRGIIEFWQDSYENTLATYDSYSLDDIDDWELNEIEELYYYVKENGKWVDKDISEEEQKEIEKLICQEVEKLSGNDFEWDY